MPSTILVRISEISRKQALLELCCCVIAGRNTTPPMMMSHSGSYASCCRPTASSIQSEVTWEDASHNDLRVTTMKFQPPLQLLHTVYLIARVLVMQTPLLTISWCPASFLSSEKIRKIARSTCHGFHSISTSEDSCLWKYSTDSCV